MSYAMLLVILSTGVFTNLVLIFFVKDLEERFDFVYGRIFVVLCILMIVYISLSIKFLPHCYKVEVDGDKIYVTKSETLFLDGSIKTIEISKSEISDIKSSLLGIKFPSTSNIFYIKMKEDTKYGNEIAFFYRKRSFFGNDLKELRAKLLVSKQ